MMNILALSLILSTLLAAEVWSPPPPENTQDVIVKEGHRVVVVEYDKDHGWNTKISISPHAVHEERTAAEKKEEGGGSGDRVHHWTEKTGAANPRELVCDAFGKCKHKIASALGVAKEAAETVGDAAGKARETAAEKAHDVEEKMEKMKRGAGEMAGEAVDKAYAVGEGATSTVREGLGKARDKASEIAGEAAHTAYTVEEGTRHTIGGAVEVAEKAYNMAGDGLGKAKHSAAEVAGEAAEQAYDMKEKTKHAVKDGFGKARDAVADKGHRAAGAATEAAKRAYEAEEEAVATVKGQVSAAAKRVGEAKETVKGKMVKATEEALGMANLAGIATAYGMGVWVTFVSSYVLARALPRHQFGIVQSKIYPVYFQAMAYSIGVALMGHFLRSWPREDEYRKLIGLVNLFLPLVFVLVNLLYLEPRASKVMFERMKMEKDEGRGKDYTTTDAGPRERGRDTTDLGPTEERPVGVTTTTMKTKNNNEMMIRLGRRLKKLNSCSSFLNVATLMSLTFYLATLSHPLLQSTPPQC